MSKQTRFILAGLIASVVLFAGLLPPLTGASQPERLWERPANLIDFHLQSAGQKNPLPPKKSTEAKPTARNEALVAATEAVLEETSEIRQLPILRPVRSSTQTKAEIQQMVIKNLEEDTTPAQMHASEVTLKRLGLAPPDFDYRALMIRLLSEQVAGYYDPKTRDFHLADWIDLDGQKPIMAHELTHALQDQHFNLQRFSKWPKGDSDAELAVHSLVEGDATLAMELYVAKDMMRALAFKKSFADAGVVTAELDKAPRALRESLLFPYQEGEKWVTALYKRGGNWREVSQAFTTLPQSSEQILHPEKYFAHEAPVKVILPDIGPLLNASVAMRSGQWAVGGGQQTAKAHHLLSTHSGAIAADDSLRTAHRSLPAGAWHRLDYDIEGEWGFYLILDQFLKAPAESRRAAAGWGGDHFAVYESAKGESLFASISIWDSEIDAHEFFDAYVKRTQLRYPNAVASDSRPAPDSRVFLTNEGNVVIELRGNRVIIVEGLPAKANVAAFLKALSA